MPTVSGRVVYDVNRNLNINGTVIGLQNISVVLQEISTLNRVIVLTNANGDFAFANVPAGSYRISEVYGLLGGVPTPGDFLNAEIASVPPAQTPPISAIPSPPPNATNVDCVSPNTIYIDVVATDVTAQYIFNGSVIYTPLSLSLDPCAVVYDINFVADADFGSFGFVPAGTAANTGPAVNPYPAISPDFDYVVPDPSDYTPIDGEFTIQNTMNNAMSNVIGAWWRISDHTTGNETGRMMVVNEDDPGAIIIRTPVPVNPDTTYLFSTWILNLFRVAGYPGPQFAVRIIGGDGNPLYNATLGSEIPPSVDAPEWHEIGAVINSSANSTLTIEFFSEGEAAVGNDFVIDDISFRQIALPVFQLTKAESTETAALGEVVTYTVTLTNHCTQPLTSAAFTDIIAPELHFVPESVIVNGIPDTAADPSVGFSVPNINGGDTLTVSFSAVAVAVPENNPVINGASLSYVYAPIPDGIAEEFTVQSNEVELYIGSGEGSADLAVVKKACRRVVNVGETAQYRISVANNGPDEAENVILTDVVPPGLLSPQYSLDDGASWQPWTGELYFGDMQFLSEVTVLLQGIVSDCMCGTVRNAASVYSSTPDPYLLNNQSEARFTVRQRAKKRRKSIAHALSKWAILRWIFGKKRRCGDDE